MVMQSSLDVCFAALGFLFILVAESVLTMVFSVQGCCGGEEEQKEESQANVVKVSVL